MKKKKYFYVPDYKLIAFLTWFANWHTPTPRRSVIVTCMTGFFHTYTKQAENILMQCFRRGYCTEHMDVVLINLPDNSNKV